MKLVSVNAILLGAVNISLFAKLYAAQGTLPPITLLILSFIYIDLILLLEYEHRRFGHFEVSMRETAQIIRKYFYLFGAGAMVAALRHFELEPPSDYIDGYVLLGRNVYYSLLYYCFNLLLGNSYLYLFRSEYAKANRGRIPSQLLRAVNGDEICTICQGQLRPRQEVARIGCMHVYHLSCLSKWAKKSQKCPTCKTPIQL